MTKYLPGYSHTTALGKNQLSFVSFDIYATKGSLLHAHGL